MVSFMAESKIEIVTTFLKAFGRQDIDSAMSHIAPDVEWHYHVGTRPVIGSENVRKVLNKLGQHQIDSRWRGRGLPQPHGSPRTSAVHGRLRLRRRQPDHCMARLL